MQTLGYTLAKVEAKELMHTLRDRLEEELETFYNPVSELEADVLVSKVASRIAVLTVKTLDRGVGRGDGQYTGRKTSTPGEGDTWLRQLLR